MKQNHYDQIISSHNNFVSLHGHHIDTTKVNIEERTSLFQQLSYYGYIREKSCFPELFK